MMKTLEYVSGGLDIEKTIIEVYIKMIDSILVCLGIVAVVLLLDCILHKGKRR